MVNAYEVVLRRKGKYYHELIIISILIGIASGVGAIAFSFILPLVSHWFFEYPVGYKIPEPNEGWGVPLPPQRPWIIPIVVALGGLLAGIIIYSTAPEAEGHGTDAAIAAFHKFAGKVRARVPIIKMIASSITIGSGGSAGREGPMAQIGSGVGSMIASLLKLDTRYRRLAVATGIGAGIGTIFKAPLGGAIFGIEVLYKRDFEVEALLPAFIASVIGYVIYGSYDGWSPVLDIPAVAFNDPFELLFYSILGVVCAALGMVYIKVFYTVKKMFSELKIPKFLKPALGGLITGIIGMYIPQVLEMGYGWITLYARGVFPLFATKEGWFFSNSWYVVAIILVFLAFLKIMATSFTIATGGSGGVFAPGLGIGALIGAALGITFINLTPNLIADPPAFLTSTVIIGAVSLFAAVSKAPVAVLIMVSEMTKTYELIGPAMLSIAIAYFLSWEYTIYPEQVEDRAHSPAHAGEFHRVLLDEILVKDAMKTDHPTVTPEASVEHALHIMIKSGLRGIPVVVDSKLVGIIALEDILNIPKDKRKTIKVKEVMNRKVVVAYPDETLYDALKAMITYNIGQLPVVKDRGSQEVIGILTRKDIIEAHDKMFLFLMGNREAEEKG